MFSEFHTFSLAQFKQYFPNIPIPEYIQVDDSYFVRIGKPIGYDGFELEFSPSEFDWEYIK